MSEAVRNHSSRLRVTLIGPVPPFRGGIAHYTAELRDALRSICSLRVISFRRQYPAWLYPGATDRESGDVAPEKPETEFVLDAFNPFSVWRSARAIAGEGCDLAIINWWTLFWAPAFLLLRLLLQRRGVEVVFLCHNLSDHDAGKWRNWLAFRFLAGADAYLVHSRAQQQQLLRLFPAKKILMHPHPAYRRFPDPTGIPVKRGRLELLFFGFIRPYKGLEVLLAALGEMQDREIFLSVAGEPWCTPEELERKTRVARVPNVEFHLGYIDKPKVAELFQRADLVVLPYLSASGSGVAALAQRYNRPILASSVGGLCEVVEEGRNGFLVEPASPEQLAARLRDLNRDRLDRMQTDIPGIRQRLSWSSLATTLLEALDRNADGRASPQGHAANRNPELPTSCRGSSAINTV